MVRTGPTIKGSTMTTLTFKPLASRPTEWKVAGASRPSSPFNAKYEATLELLDRELRHLGARDVFLQVDASERDVRLDGQLRADASVTHPGVILTVETRDGETLVWSCDRFASAYWKRDSSGWKANLRAIALGLEALRKVERYGIAERGQQYAGFKALPAGELGDEYRDGAARFMAEYSGVEVTGVSTEAVLADAFRLAAKKLHPDNGGDPAHFARLQDAYRLLRGDAS